MTEAPKSIFRELYSDTPFVDRYESEPDNAVDVIIPVMHTNELWRSNLMSIYREIPVKRLLLGDGGVIDDTVEVAREFPRVEVHDHTEFVSLGYSIRKLIEAVETDWFVYLHSDVYLPPGWFEAMNESRAEYDWFECPQRLTVLVEYPMVPNSERSYSGSQMGRKSAFEKVLPQIDDDYLYRNEDIIFSTLIRNAGQRWGRVEDTFHYHELMNKRSKWLRTFKSVSFEVERGPKEEVREFNTQVRGIIKYLQPEDYLIYGVQVGVDRLRQLGAIEWDEFAAWVQETNPAWLDHIHKDPPFKQRLRNWLRRLAMKMFG